MFDKNTEILNKDRISTAAQAALVVENPPASAGDSGLIPGFGRPPGEGNGNPLQNSCLDNATDTEAWWPTVIGDAKSQTGLSEEHFHFHCPISF